MYVNIVIQVPNKDSSAQAVFQFGNDALKIRTRAGTTCAKRDVSSGPGRVPFVGSESRKLVRTYCFPRACLSNLRYLQVEFLTKFPTSKWGDGRIGE